MAQRSALVFEVRRQPPELVAPARPTTHEFKSLSDIDDQKGLRHHIPAIMLYRHNPTLLKGKDPVMVIKSAIAEALVFYYPLAGRLREGPGEKLVVDCTGEGILFVGADADVALSDFGDTFQLPFPCVDELIYGVPGSSGIVDCPLLLIQVTRLKCGGFIVGFRFNHTMTDAIGLVQFMMAVGEIARGAIVPSIKHIWQRHLLNARDEPRVTCTHNEFVQVAGTKRTVIPHDDLAWRSLFFGPAEFSALRRFVPSHLGKCSKFDVLTASIWRCRTISLQLDPEEEVRLMSAVDSRPKFTPPLPVGFYGNAIALPVAQATAGKLSQNPLGYALELVIRAKSQVTEEYMKSTADLMVTCGRPFFTVESTFAVSDISRVGFEEVDFGWGKTIYGGPAIGAVGGSPVMSSFLMHFTNKKGENGILVPLCLPAPAMIIFERELNYMLNDSAHMPCMDRTSTFIASKV